MTDEEKQLENEQSSPAEDPELTESIQDNSAVAEPVQQDAAVAQAEMPQEEVEAAADNGKEGAASANDYAAALAELSQTIDTLKAQLEDRTNQYLRIAADFENFRKRNLKEREDLEIQVKCATISELLPVVDNFERARLQLKPQTEAEVNIHKSYQSVYKQLVECLKRVGVSPMRSEGKAFDPNFHEAVIREPTNEHEEGTVIEELVRGYLLGDRVLRHALVKVAAPLESASNEEAEVN